MLEHDWSGTHIKVGDVVQFAGSGPRGIVLELVSCELGPACLVRWSDHGTSWESRKMCMMLMVVTD